MKKILGKKGASTDGSKPSGKRVVADLVDKTMGKSGGSSDRAAAGGSSVSVPVDKSRKKTEVSNVVKGPFPDAVDEPQINEKEAEALAADAKKEEDRRVILGLENFLSRVYTAFHMEDVVKDNHFSVVGYNESPKKTTLALANAQWEVSFTFKNEV
jgi:hypothetical protein